MFFGLHMMEETEESIDAWVCWQWSMKGVVSDVQSHYGFHHPQKSSQVPLIRDSVMHVRLSSKADGQEDQGLNFLINLVIERHYT